ncbi:histidine phosphatase family protein [bacterium]|nr:histidine phosphatase family protein [bacterium]
MRLCLVRHGIAVPRSPEIDDGERPLAPEAMDRTRAALAGLATLFRPEAILTSPLLRARQTAAIAAELCGLPRSIDCAGLATGDQAAVLGILRDADASAAMLVGHEPWLSGLTSLLLTGTEGRPMVQIKKGGALLIEADSLATPRSGVMVWLMQPGMLRRFAEH